LQQITEISFTPYQAHGVEKITAWRGRKIFLAMQKNDGKAVEIGRQINYYR
jgi:hypothetical protein